MRATSLLLVGAVALSGCALLGKSDPDVPRYFMPDFDDETAAEPVRAGLQLRLGQVEGWAHLRERMVARSEAHELLYYEDRRWTELPEVYLRRGLTRALFEQRGLVESLTARGAPVLDVELIAFEEIEKPHTARLEARVVLHDDRVSLLEETVLAEQPIAEGSAKDSARAQVDALSEALHAGIKHIADDVVKKLSSQTP